MVDRFKMVGKLIKYELLNTARVAAIPAAVMVMLAIISRISLETSNSDFAVIVIVFYFFAVMATMLIGYFFGISSFYQSLFTGNGYLTLSLPVNADQLIWAKLLSAMISMFASIIVCILSSCIFFIGLPEAAIEEIKELINTFTDILVNMPPEAGLYIFETILLSLLSIPMSFLIFYAAMSIGQLFTVKNRKGIAIALYIGVMFLWSLFSETALTPLIIKMNEVSVHLTMWISIAFVSLVAVGCYFIVRHIIKNKVNLLA